MDIYLAEKLEASWLYNKADSQDTGISFWSQLLCLKMVMVI